jgi:hypothetical protein
VSGLPVGYAFALMAWTSWAGYVPPAEIPRTNWILLPTLADCQAVEDWWRRLPTLQDGPYHGVLRSCGAWPPER